MKKMLLLAVLACCAVLTADDLLMKNGVKAWSDRDYIVTNLADSFQFKKAVPAQKCSGYTIVLPKDTKKALIAVCASNAAVVEALVKKYNFKPANSEMYIGDSKRPKILKYTIFIVENPPEKIECRTTNAGGILLALNDDVPAALPAK